MASKTIVLDSGESQEVVFQVTPKAPGSYHVQLDGLSGTFTAVEFAADFEVDGLVIDPSEVAVGQPVTISCRVTNVGGKTGSKTITLEVT